jgi:hypothetical protein
MKKSSNELMRLICACSIIFLAMLFITTSGVPLIMPNEADGCAPNYGLLPTGYTKLLAPPPKLLLKPLFDLANISLAAFISPV